VTLSDLESLVLSVVDRVVDTSILQRVSLDIGNDWKCLGRQLGCSDAELDSVNYDYHHCGQREVAYEMLRGWHERTGNGAKLAVLARALINIRRPDIALKLQDTPPQ